MSITLDLPAELLTDLRQVTHLEDDGSAVEFAITEYLRKERLRKFADDQGDVEMTDDWKRFNEVEITSEVDDA